MLTSRSKCNSTFDLRAVGGLDAAATHDLRELRPKALEDGALPQTPLKGGSWSVVRPDPAAALRELQHRLRPDRKSQRGVDYGLVVLR
jgi:hypothetical protein